MIFAVMNANLSCVDVHYARLTSQGVQHRVFYLDGHPSRYQPRPTGLNFGEQTGTGVFPLVIAVPIREELRHQLRHPGRGLDLKAKDLIGHL